MMKFSILSLFCFFGVLFAGAAASEAKELSAIVSAATISACVEENRDYCQEENLAQDVCESVLIQQCTFEQDDSFDAFNFDAEDDLSVEAIVNGNVRQATLSGPCDTVNFRIRTDRWPGDIRYRVFGPDGFRISGRPYGQRNNYRIIRNGLAIRETPQVELAPGYYKVNVRSRRDRNGIDRDGEVALSVDGIRPAGPFSGAPAYWGRIITQSFYCGPTCSVFFEDPMQCFFEGFGTRRLRSVEGQEDKPMSANRTMELRDKMDRALHLIETGLGADHEIAKMAAKEHRNMKRTSPPVLPANGCSLIARFFSCFLCSVSEFLVQGSIKEELVALSLEFDASECF